jgi:hypothetical protein
MLFALDFYYIMALKIIIFEMIWLYGYCRENHIACALKLVSLKIAAHCNPLFLLFSSGMNFWG